MMNKSSSIIKCLSSLMNNSNIYDSLLDIMKKAQLD